jgi:hypothetical protein
MKKDIKVGDLISYDDGQYQGMAVVKELKGRMISVFWMATYDDRIPYRFNSDRFDTDYVFSSDCWTKIA